MDQKLRFGIIGCSSISERSTIPAIQKSDFAELAMIGSRSETKAKQFAEKFGCDKFGSYESVLNDDDIDAVYISTPVGTHEEWSVKAANAGKHILCEKSSTTSLESAKKMVDCCTDNKVRIMEGFMFRFHPQHQKVKELINDGKIGEMKSFSGVFGFPAVPEGDIRYDAGLGGGFLNDSGCYPICASRMIFNEEPVTVGCQFKSDVAGVDVKGTSFLIYKNQKSATITYGNGNYYQAKYEVWGSDGVISLDRAYSVPSDFITKVNLQHNTENNWEGRQNEIFEIQPKDHFLEILDTFCMEITGSEKTPFNFEEELLNQAKVMEAHRQSAITAKMIWLSEL